MTPDFDKIQAGMVGGLNKTQKVNSEKTQVEGEKSSCKSIGREDMEAGAAGRSSVKMDNFETDMRKFKENPMICAVAMALADELMEQGYTPEEATAAAFSEFNLA